MIMPKGRPITFYEREQIESFLRLKRKKTWIAKELNRDYSIIKREIKRNSSAVLEYNAKTAQEVSDRRKKNTNKRKLEKHANEKLLVFVEESLEKGLSPEQITGVLKEHPPKELKKSKDKTVSHESIYDWIYNGDGKVGGWYKKLRRKQKKRNAKISCKQRKKSRIKERISIHDRPSVIDERTVIGHWETDSVIFSGRSILSVQFERKSKLCRLHKCHDKSALASEEALRDSIDSLGEELWLSITRDNGTENVLHHETEVPSYFCDPYCSWQKGGVENLNGLIREYLPKKTNLDTVSTREIHEIQEKLNNRPRKANNYLSPNQVVALFKEKGALNS
jgi:IS30 family transposase